MTHHASFQTVQEACAIQGLNLQEARSALRAMEQDARRLKKGGVWLALQGEKNHALYYAEQALAQGVAFALAESSESARVWAARCPQLRVIWLPEGRGALLALLDWLFPGARALTLFGITGTNGKSSSGYLLAQLLAKSGEKVSMLGTMGYGVVHRDARVVWQSTGMTTPDLLGVYRQLDQAHTQGITHLVMEVSSHALVQGRVDGLSFEAVGMTQLSQDHLDYHLSMAAYAQAKQLLFTQVNSRCKVLNLSDPWQRAWIEQGLVSDAWTYGEDDSAQLFIKNAQADALGWSFELANKTTGWRARLNLLGAFQLQNLCLVLAMWSAMGNTLESALEHVDQLMAPKGRMDEVLAHPFVILVDFAHTPDALENLLKSLRAHGHSRLWCVFGAGGDRDATKRARMGEAVSRWADGWVITDDNPRHEAPEAIRRAIIEGLDPASAATKVWTEMGDRQAAIDWAVAHLQAGDCLVVAGKGHETGQQVRDRFEPFSDYLAIESALERNRPSPSQG
jgi:UDP-N-acetylmuramoyl-L-alanyl-D-glutamate--2,6-diaminopimelate ligase